MGFWERLIGSDPVSSNDTQELVSELALSCTEEQGLAQQLRDHAEQAPHHAGAEQLRAVAEQQDRVVQLLRDALRARGGVATAEPQPAKGGQNHWARVVHDLADNQALMKRYGEQLAYWDPEVPDAAQVFRSLERDKSRIGAALRDIALRADSHALD